MDKVKIRRLLAWGALVALIIGVFCINRLCIDDHDTLSYAFAGQRSTLETRQRVASLSDIVSQQYHDYIKPGINGRVLVHGVTALFSAFRLWLLFDVANTAVWLLFTWLLLHEGGLRWRQTPITTWALGAIGVWWCLWYGETTLNIAFALNYLWTATATLLMMIAWRRLTWWMVPLAFLYGWTQECFVVPMVATLAAAMVVRSLLAHRRAFSFTQLFAWLAMTAGAAFLCLGPAARSRASTSMLGPGLWEVLKTSCRAQMSFVLMIWAPLLMLFLLGVLWRSRHAFRARLLPNLEWWLYLAMAYGCYWITASNGVVRVVFPAMMAAVILTIQHRHELPFSRRLYAVGAAVALLWLTGAAIVQYRLSSETRAMIARYQADPQGITCRTPITTGFFDQSIWTGVYTRGGRTFWTLEVGHPRPMSVFSPWLYRTLYASPTDYFAVAQAIPGTPCYCAPQAPQVLVARGDVTPMPEETCRMWAALQANNPKLPRWLPGRFTIMFPRRDDLHFGLPADRFVFTAADGQQYTLFTAERNKPKWLAR